MTVTAIQKPVNPYAKTYADFVEQTKDHDLVILHDDGLYRHLRVQAPGTRMWSWDVTTWPGRLATSGDIADGHVFSREPDMLQFFAIAGRSVTTPTAHRALTCATGPRNSAAADPTR